MLRVGYVLDERVDEPGEAAIRGEVVDIFPAGAEAASEVVVADPAERYRAIEHWLPSVYGSAETLFDFARSAGS